MKILLVEDEIKLARAIKRGLSDEAMNVDVVHDGPSGLASALGDSCDVIILDRMLPGGMDGVEICQKIRAENNRVPILMLTAKAQIRDRVEGLNTGADDYLTKPFAFDELIARVRALARRPAEAHSVNLQVGDLEIDNARKEVRRAGEVIALSHTEYSLLEYLMRRAGQTVSKEMIIEGAWDSDANILPNTVEVYIKYLRAKIDAPFAKQLIKTVRGFGYKLEADGE